MSRGSGVSAGESAGGASATEPIQVAEGSSSVEIALPSPAYPLARVVVAQSFGMVPSRADMAAFFDKVRRIVAGVTRGLPRADREDLAQDVGLDLWRAEIMKPQEPSLESWVRIAALRRCWRQRSQRASTVELGDRPIEVEDPLDLKLQWQEVLNMLLELAASWSDVDRALLVLDMLGVQPVELSRERGCPEGTIRGGLFRVREKLHRGLANHVEVAGLARANIDAVRLCMKLLGEPDSPPPTMTSETIRRLSQKATILFHESLRPRRRAR
jgi:DNA-directed RNA polymerase specialized sigma24 family protein